MSFTIRIFWPVDIRIHYEAPRSLDPLYHLSDMNNLSGCSVDIFGICLLSRRAARSIHCMVVLSMLMGTHVWTYPTWRRPVRCESVHVLPPCLWDCTNDLASLASNITD